MRCLSCLKPICEECAVYDNNNQSYCSKQCLARSINSSEVFAKQSAQMATDRRVSFIKKIIIFAILIALVFFGYQYYKDNPKIANRAKALRNKAKQEAKALQNKAKRTTQQLKNIKTQ